MADRLTRRERAAMVDAIEALRALGPAETTLTDALVVLGVAEDGGARLCGAIEIAAQRARWPLTMPGYERRERLVRARLALYLRARLRADAGDCGRETPIPLPAKCRHWMHEQDSDGRCGYLRCGCWTQTRRIAPLWQSAPETRR